VGVGGGGGGGALGVGAFLLLFLQSLLIVLTVIKVERAAGLVVVSSKAIESAEKRLVVAEELLRVRPCASSVILLREDEGCTGAGDSDSQYADDRPLGLDEKRPKGSGERGMIGDSTAPDGRDAK
jgi:hypothetical protein